MYTEDEALKYIGKDPHLALVEDNSHKGTFPPHRCFLYPQEQGTFGNRTGWGMTENQVEALSMSRANPSKQHLSHPTRCAFFKKEQAKLLISVGFRILGRGNDNMLYNKVEQLTEVFLCVMASSFWNYFSNPV